MKLRVLLLIALISFDTHAADVLDPLRDTAERFMLQQTQGHPGKIQVKVGTVDTSRLPPCAAYEGFLPSGTRLAGRTHVGIRCLGPNSWSVLVPVQIVITGTYVTTARPLPAGHTIARNDIAEVKGDLSALPNGIVTESRLAIGKTLRNALGSGQVLRSDQLQAPWVIRQGQSVRVVSQGTGFAVAAEGKALNNAAAGQLAQIRMPSGQTVSGIAQADGSVEISF